MKLSHRILLAFVLTLFQVSVIFLAAPGQSFATKELALHRADALWYASIVDRGYVSAVPPESQNLKTSNVAFFPGYPKWAALIQDLTGVPAHRALLWASWFSMFWVWFYTLSILTLWRCPRVEFWSLIALLMSHPAAFFYGLGYSEGTFTAAWLGFFYWQMRSRPVLSAWHGFYGNFTRLSGILGSIFLQKRKILTAFIVSGGVVFFIYCQIRFGIWDLYQQTERIGWGQEADYLAPFKSLVWSHWWASWFSAWEIGLALTAWLGLGLWVWLLGIFKSKLPRQPALGFWLMGASIWYVSVAGTYHQQLSSMLRFTLPIWFVVILGGTPMLGLLSPRARKMIWLAGLAITIWGFLNQIHFVRDITRDIWVA